ncbi:DUF1476 domain-containing protein [Terrihabitans rhizophilus]|uniref:DUF1476 domain-containing protein n=1 Tax=Terrihabitans rhizophilus TaxID=3092662 RepID=A0ABU4RV33_9HYPH|nr:DUF1476 domain-containing protein [Terrihabitans sp. PJ23]MDX6807480.1 DUF1476 domain-containing protein [Terrihabitans sp. PJ23]
MTTFDKRKDAFEAKYALDEEHRFLAYARRNRALGLWAASKLGKTGADADDYAKDVVNSDLIEAGEEDVFRKVFGDLQSAGCDVSEDDVRDAMLSHLDAAMAEIRKR